MVVKSVDEELVDVICQTLGVRRAQDLGNISRDTRLIEDLGFESILLIQLVINIEEHFNVLFKAEKLLAENLNLFGSLADQVRQLVGGKNG